MPQPGATAELSKPTIIEAIVTANPRICREHHRLTLWAPGFPLAVPGQFVHLIRPWQSTPPIPVDHPDDAPPSYTWSEPLGQPTVRRAFSIADLRRHHAECSFDVIYRVVGRCTTWMAGLQLAAVVNVLGPLGNGFSLSPATRLALLVAGGVGLPPLLWWARHLAESGIETIVFIGAQSRDLLPLALTPSSRDADQPVTAPEFSRHGVSTIFSTDDGSLGHHGYVTAALEDWLHHHGPPADRTGIYTCGPEPMMRRVAELAREGGLACQLCMERSMACGMGTCQSCVVPVHDCHAADGWRYKLCCTDGPVFDSREVSWS